MMNCEQCKAHLLDYAYGELPDDKAQEVSKALAGCDECQQELARIKHVRGVFQEVMPAAEPPAMMRANILRQARLEAYAAKEAGEVSLLDKFQALISHPGFASAAAILLVVVGVFYVLSAEDRETPADFAAEQATLSPGYDESIEKDIVLAEAEEDDAKAAPPPVAADQGMKQERAAKLDSDKAPAIAAKALEEPQAQLKSPPAPERYSEAKAKAAPPNQPSAGNAAPRGEVAKAQKPSARRDNLDDLLAAAEPPANSKKEPATARQREAAPQQAPAESLAWDANKDTRRAPRDAEAEEAPLADEARLGAVAADDNVAPFGGDADGEAVTGNMLSPGSAAPGRGVGGVGGVKSGDYAGSNMMDAADEDEQADAFDEKSQYDAAYRRYTSGDYAGAARGFDEFMKEAPRTSNYFALALHMRGKSQYAQGNYAGAAASFRRVIREYPSSERREEARYLLAESLLRQDPGSAEARRILEEQMGGGGGGVSGRAKDTHDQYFGNRPASRRPSKAPRKKSSPARPKRSYDSMESPGDDFSGEAIELE